MGAFILPAQKFLQIETYGKAKAKKIHIGTKISYQLTKQKEWHTGVIRDFLVEKNTIELEDRFLVLPEITALRFERKNIPAISSSLYIFGAAWSTFALIGYSTDGNPETKYSGLDLGVTLASGILAWSLNKFFKHKSINIGNRKKLRLVDIRFQGF